MEFLKNLKSCSSQYNLTVDKVGQGWIIKLPSICKFDGELSIGPGALDWYLNISHFNLKKPYVDWMDYLGYDNKPESKLIMDKLHDINWFLKQWHLTQDLKIVTKSSFFGLIKNQKILWKQNNNWSEVIMCDLER